MSIGENLKLVKARMEDVRGEKRAGAGLGHLIAVSKTRPVEDIELAIESGQRLFGENRVQEAMAKFPALKSQYKDLQLHLIGPLQSNKVKEAVAHFDVIQTIDRPKIAKVIAREMKEQNRDLTLFVQVNVGEEPQKGGVLPQDLEGLLAFCRDEYGLDISGLMCIPPVDAEPSPYFVLLRRLAQSHGIELLSMGMSADFESALQFGADYVRVGSAIFGRREAPKNS